MAVDTKEFYDKIYRYCFYKVRSSTAAEDITQETFLRYFAQNTEIRNGDTAYIYTIAKNLCIDFFRRKPTEELDENYPDADFSPDSDNRVAVREAMQKLEEKKRELLLLRYSSGLSAKETAEVMGLSRFAVYRMERTALAEMKKLLKGAC